MNTDFPNDHVAARCPACRRIAYIAVNDPRVIGGDERREIAAMVVDGFAIEHMTLEQFKPEPFGHADACPRAARNKSAPPEVPA